MGQRTPRPGPVPGWVCFLFLAGSGGPASWAPFGAPHFSLSCSRCSHCFLALWFFFFYSCLSLSSFLFFPPFSCTTGVSGFLFLPALGALGLGAVWLPLPPFPLFTHTRFVRLPVVSGPGCPGIWRRWFASPTFFCFFSCLSLFFRVPVLSGLLRFPAAPPPPLISVSLVPSPCCLFPHVPSPLSSFCAPVGRSFLVVSASCCPTPSPWYVIRGCCRPAAGFPFLALCLFFSVRLLAVRCWLLPPAAVPRSPSL